LKVLGIPMDDIRETLKQLSERIFHITESL
jgi:hypothetical protein